MTTFRFLMIGGDRHGDLIDFRGPPVVYQCTRRMGQMEWGYVAPVEWESYRLFQYFYGRTRLAAYVSDGLDPERALEFPRLRMRDAPFCRQEMDGKHSHWNPPKPTNPAEDYAEKVGARVDPLTEELWWPT